MANLLARLREKCSTEYSRAEYDLLWQYLDAHDWVQQDAAKALGVPPTTMQRAVRRHPRLRQELDDRGLTFHYS